MVGVDHKIDKRMTTRDLTMEPPQGSVDRRQEPAWLAMTLEALKYTGYMVVENVLSQTFVAEIHEHMYDVQPKIIEAVGQDRLDRAGEQGVLRLMMKYDPFFLRLLDIPEILEIVDATVSNTAILHLQNGFILPSRSKGKAPEIFQTSFHRDFPRYLNGYLASVNTFIALDDFTPKNGATVVIPGSHQKASMPDADYMQQHQVPVICSAGALIVFDSTLVHAAGFNTSGKDRLGINQQYTRSFIKQQIDYVRALGDDVILEQPPRVQQLLGYYTRVVTSLDEYYQPEEKRLYRKGQG